MLRTEPTISPRFDASDCKNFWMLKPRHPRFEFRPKSRNLAYMNPRLEPITEHKLTFQFKLRTDAETYFKPNRNEPTYSTRLDWTDGCHQVISEPGRSCSLTLHMLWSTYIAFFHWPVCQKYIKSLSKQYIGYIGWLISILSAVNRGPEQLL